MPAGYTVTMSGLMLSSEKLVSASKSDGLPPDPWYTINRGLAVLTS